MALRKPVPTNPVPNPLHQYASYTYSWALWWLSKDDKKVLDDCADAGAALAFNPGLGNMAGSSFVLAEDGGILMGNRQPGSPRLNYHIQDVQFDTMIAPSKTSRSSNMIDGSMTIIEPYGVTLIDTLIAASHDGTTYRNYTDQPFLLELRFRGYDDKGNPIPDSEIDIYKKRFPIQILSIKVSVTGKGTEYKISFCPSGAMAHVDKDYATTPKNFSITAGTLEEFFTGPNGLQAQFLDFFKEEVVKGQREYAEQIKFNIDPEILKNGKIVNETKVPLTNANPKVKKIDLSKSTFNIPRGTPILDIITKIMAHSDYLINVQLGLERENKSASQTDIFNHFRTTTKLRYAGVDQAGNEQYGVFDVRKNISPKTVEYNITQYSTMNGKHPDTNLFADSIPYTSKVYNYIYTGLNTDVTDLKLTFDNTYFTSVLGYTSAVAAENSQEDTNIDKLQSAGPVINLNPAIFGQLSPVIGAIPNSTPLKYKTSVGNPNITSQMNTLNRPAAQRANDVLNSIYSSDTGDMVQVQLGIVGDPTLIKQDDWLYVPSVTSTENISMLDYSARYGHIPMDQGDVVVTLTIRSPIDMDADIYNEGLAYPQPAYTQSLFSGQYQIIKIVNKFSGGKFDQTLHMARYMNSDYVTAFKMANQLANRESDPVIVGTDADKPLVSTNTVEVNNGKPLVVEINGTRE